MKLLSTLAGIAIVATPLFGQPAITVYNQNFAVVRESVSLDLKSGVNAIEYTGVTALLEPDSVILRDPADAISLNILEQNYWSNPIDQTRLLTLFEGETIEFQTITSTGEERITLGKIIRGTSGTGEAIIEANGIKQFNLPGEPIFPALPNDTVLKPTLNWQIEASKPGKLDAELAYVTGGMTWNASYNIITPEEGNHLDLTGWVTIQNRSGKEFKEAQIKLMAGDVSKIQPREKLIKAANKAWSQLEDRDQAITEKSFDEYHLYTLARPSTLHDGETKQIEFIQAERIESRRIYVYDGLTLNWNQWRNYNSAHRRRNRDFGNYSHTKVSVVCEFKNSKENHLGLPLPKGRVRFYRQDADQQLQFIGENEIDHTPKDEMVRLTIGNAFDLVGSRTRTNFTLDSSRNGAEESIEIKLRNHKKEPVEIVVVEHLYRWTNWEITAKSDPFVKRAAQKIEFRVQLKPDEEKTLTYTAHYTW